MTKVEKFRAVVEKHTKELEAWVAADPANAKSASDHYGERTVREYLMDYGDKFWITYYLANDIGFPDAERFEEELTPFTSLEGLMS